jgi:sodium transport system permease protein
MKKECSRLFMDKRLLFTAVIMPGLLIYLMYTLMGSFMGKMFQTSEDYTYQIYVVNQSENFSDYIAPWGMPINFITTSDSEVEALKQKISDKEIDLLIKFPADFDKSVENYDVKTSPDPAPNIQIWCNAVKTESASADSMIKNSLYAYQSSMAKKFDINYLSNETPDENYNVATDSDMMMSVMGMLLPMLLIMFMFTGCMAIAPESIAGEKERGTLGTLLVTPARRSDIAIGKILSIAIFGLMGAAGSFIGLMASLPKIMQMDGASAGVNYSLVEYFLIFIVCVSTVLVFVSLLSVLSAYSKSIKEATAYSTPLMIVCIVFGLSSMLTGGVPEQIYYYLIPVFNSAQCLTAIFTGEISAVNIAVTAGINIAVMLICVFGLTRMFNSEKIVFDK